jgi:hypothetical protein
MVTNCLQAKHEIDGAETGMLGGILNISVTNFFTHAPTSVFGPSDVHYLLSTFRGVNIAVHSDRQAVKGGDGARAGNTP